MKRRIWSFIALILMTVFCISCVDDERKTIVITETSVQVIVGDTYELTCRLNGIEADELEYEFSVDGIAAIEGFTIEGLAPGTTILTIRHNADDKIFDTVTIEVTGAPSVAFTAAELILKVGERKSLPITYANIDSFEELGFTVSAEGIVTLDEEDIIGEAPGEVEITAYYLFDNSVAATLKVKVEAEKRISFSIERLELEAGESAELPLVTEGISDLSEIAFSFTTEGIALLEQRTVTGINPGETALTVRLIADEDVAAEITILVKPRSYTVNDPEYWIEHLSPEYDPDGVIMTPAQIALYNQNIYNNTSATKVVNPLAYPTTISGTEVRQKIETYNGLIDQYQVFDDSHYLSQNEKTTIKNNRALEQIPATVTVRYGIITEFAAVRSFPTNCIAGSYSQDRFQETGLNVGEGVAVYHVTADGQWFFVQAMNYFGWVEAGKIGLCSREMLLSFIDSEQFIVVTADTLNIDGRIVRMGQALPYVTKNDQEYQVQMPRRDAAGNLVLHQIAVARDDEKVHDGYLPYTLRNVFIQAFKMLGIPYSWGDNYVYGRDCSSTQNAVYACFGFKMPRNTSQQRSIPQYAVTMNINESYIKNNLRPGALIFSSGHVMMYIGDDDQGNAYIYHNTSPKCKVQKFREYSSQIIAYLRLY